MTETNASFFSNGGRSRYWWGAVAASGAAVLSLFAIGGKLWAGMGASALSTAGIGFVAGWAGYNLGNAYRGGGAAGEPPVQPI